MKIINQKDYFDFTFTSKPHIRDTYRKLIEKSEKAHHHTSVHSFFYYARYRMGPYATKPLLSHLPEYDFVVLPCAKDNQEQDIELLRDKSHDNWKLFFDHCTFEELVAGMKGDSNRLFALIDDINKGPDDEFIELCFDMPDTLDHPEALKRYKRMLKKMRHGQEKSDRDHYRYIFERAIKRKGGKHGPPNVVLTKDALNLMEKLALYLREKITDYLHYYHWKEVKFDKELTDYDKAGLAIDENMYKKMKHYFTEINHDPRIASISYSEVRELLNSKTGASYIENIINSHLTLTRKLLKNRTSTAE
jgi:hypothetical protein